MTSALIAYVASVSVVLFLYMIVDKKRAMKHQWRISEKTLLILGAAGGAIGGVLAMYLFRHKTKHTIFAFGFPLMAAVHIYLIVQTMNYFG